MVCLAVISCVVLLNSVTGVWTHQILEYLLQSAERNEDYMDSVLL